MTDSTPHTGDLTTLSGTVTENGVAVDISSATTMTVRLRSPKGVVIEFTGVFTTDGTDGKMQYQLTPADDPLEPGCWGIQVFVEIAGWYGHSDAESLEVEENF